MDDSPGGAYVAVFAMYAANDGSQPFAAQIAIVIPKVDVFNRPEDSALFFTRLAGARARCSGAFAAPWAIGGLELKFEMLINYK